MSMPTAARDTSSYSASDSFARTERYCLSSFQSVWPVRKRGARKGFLFFAASSPGSTMVAASLMINASVTWLSLLAWSSMFPTCKDILMSTLRL